MGLSAFARSDAQGNFFHGNVITRDSIAIAAIKEKVFSFAESFILFLSETIIK